MPKVYTYRKIIDKFTTNTLFEPHSDDEDSARITELCAVDGLTYVFVPDGITYANHSNRHFRYYESESYRCDSYIIL